MDEFLKMDIFFVVATVATVVLAVLMAFVLVRVLRILRRVDELSQMLSEEGKELRADIAHVRAEFIQKGLIMGALAAASRAFTRPKRRKDTSS